MDEPRWTFSQGLMRMMRTLLIRAATVLAVWLGLLLLITPWINGWLVGGFARSHVLFILPGSVIGAAMAWRLVEAAGCTHWVVPTSGIAFAVTAIAAGVVLSNAMQPIHAPLPVFIVTSLAATSWICHPHGGRFVMTRRMKNRRRCHL